jgi:hypothetical protein
MDTDKNGTITIDELRRGLREQGSTVSEEELDTLVSDVHRDARGATVPAARTSPPAFRLQPALLRLS